MKWNINIPDPAAVASLVGAGYHPLAANFLVQRGLDTPAKSNSFLKHSSKELHDPFLLDGMDAAVSRLRLAVERKELVAVYGDYDVDGVTATAIMIRTLKALGVECIWHIPDRALEGYGMNAEAVTCLAERGATLIVTVDTGVSSVSEVELAKSLGVDVIITDHHECTETLPNALAVINPRLPDSPYPFPDLAGVGVAFKLVCALADGWKAPLTRFADLVALGTIADIMPVVGENRLLITQGLKAMERTSNPGLRALIAKLERTGAITADTVSYTLAPKINAAGRVKSAEIALELLLTDDRARAFELADELCELNILRQSREGEIAKQAEAMLDLSSPAFVLYRKDWHIGVAGIVASRMAEQYDRPAFIATLEGDIVRGSARATHGVNLAELLSRHQDLLETFGGHGLAAGFSVKLQNFEAFKSAICAECAALSEIERRLEIDAEVSPEWLDISGIASLEELSPFGEEFEPPTFCMTSVKLDRITPIGNGKHLRFDAIKNEHRVGAVWFNKTIESLDLPNGEVYANITFRAEINRFRGHEAPQLRIIALDFLYN